MNSDELEQLIRDSYLKWQQEPDNPAHSLAIVAAYAQRQEYANAIPWLREAIAQTSRPGGDAKAVGALQKLLNLYEILAKPISSKTESATVPAFGEQHMIHQKLEALNELLKASATSRS